MMAKKILVVDDEKPISDIVKFNLDKEGYDVVTAYDGEEALKKVESESPDLILLDLMLPKIDGLEVARQIRKEHDTPDWSLGQMIMLPSRFPIENLLRG